MLGYENNLTVEDASHEQIILKIENFASLSQVKEQYFYFAITECLYRQNSKVRRNSLKTVMADQIYLFSCDKILFTMIILILI